MIHSSGSIVSNWSIFSLLGIWLRLRDKMKIEKEDRRDAMKGIAILFMLFLVFFLGIQTQQATKTDIDKKIAELCASPQYVNYSVGLAGINSNFWINQPITNNFGSQNIFNTSANLSNIGNYGKSEP